MIYPKTLPGQWLYTRKKWGGGMTLHTSCWVFGTADAKYPQTWKWNRFHVEAWGGSNFG
jgi:hypothetical protein